MARNEDIKHFLTKHRAAIDPHVYGFTSGQRRVKGLRREEVAQLAAVSVSWYTWLEQGRDINISAAALQRIAKVLQLTTTEQDYLHALVFGGTTHAGRSQDVPDEVKIMVDALEPHPAFVRCASMDILYWNKACESKIFNWSAIAPEDRNSVKLMFINPDYKKIIHRWETAASHTLAAFRASYAEAKNRDDFEVIIADLQQRSPEFRAMWASHDVNIIGSGLKSIAGSGEEIKHYKYTSLTLEENPELRVIFYLEKGLVE